MIWAENNILRPMRQQVELMSLMNQFNASSMDANLPNVSQGITGSYSATWMQIHVVDLFRCKVLVCENCCSVEIHPFYFQDPKEDKSSSTIIGHPALNIRIQGCNGFPTKTRNSGKTIQDDSIASIFSRHGP